MTRGKFLRVLAVLSLIGLLLVACSRPAAPVATSSPAGAARGAIQVYVTDAPPKGVAAIEIKAAGIEAHMAGAADESWVSVLKDPPVFDLVKAIGVNLLLGTSEVAAGKYTQVRLDITNVMVTLDGKQVKASVPSDKLRLVGDITIEEGKQTSVTLDFDAEKSIVLEGQNRVALKPVIRLVVGKPGEAVPTPAATSAPTATTAPTATPTTAASAGIAEVRAMDAPPGGVSKILVTTGNIQVHRADAAEESWTTIVSAESTFDLVQYQDAEFSLGQSELAAGKYTQVRFDVTRVVVTSEGKDIVARVPSDKIKIVGPFEIKTGEKTVLTLDFEADKFVVITGNDQAQVKPVIKLGVSQGDRPLKTRGDEKNVVSGTVTYLEKIALDPTAVITVKLVDVSSQGSPVTIGQQIITAAGNQVPFSFKISFNGDSTKASGSYALQADITLNGQKLFTTDKDYPVITKGNPSKVDITLKKV